MAAALTCDGLVGWLLCGVWCGRRDAYDADKNGNLSAPEFKALLKDFIRRMHITPKPFASLLFAKLHADLLLLCVELTKLLVKHNTETPQDRVMSHEV